MSSSGTVDVHRARCAAGASHLLMLEFIIHKSRTLAICSDVRPGSGSCTRRKALRFSDFRVAEEPVAVA